ncbi:MAG: RNA 2',3'-cyclic phosphodiesterase [Patescibacteria group bacterium]|nr:RNA 2',3'-cyclic phosphodiesterase [Patescibacteria group bacterium]
MRRRLFFALNVDERTKEAIQKSIAGLRPEFDRRFRFVPPENWHITVSFLGAQDNGRLTNIMRAAKEAAKHFEPMVVTFERLQFGPDDRHPRMIWMATDQGTSGQIGELKGELEARLAGNGVSFERESRPFAGHITLARTSRNGTMSDAGRTVPGTVPFQAGPLHLKCTIDSIDLMESELKKSGSEYAILQNFHLAGSSED